MKDGNEVVFGKTPTGSKIKLTSGMQIEMMRKGELWVIQPVNAGVQEMGKTMLTVAEKEKEHRRQCYIGRSIGEM